MRARKLTTRTFYPAALLAGAAATLALAGCQPAPPPRRVVYAPPRTVIVRTQAPPQEAAPIRLSADALFAFGKATLRMRRYEQLDRLADRLKSSPVQSIRLVGYTDRIGNAEANRRLSEQRAATIRDYLVARGVPAGLIRIEGRGEADPVAACDGVQGKTLIACLAPNRRVEIHVVMAAAEAVPPPAPIR